jgi:biopolymer transport protein ExbB
MIPSRPTLSLQVISISRTLRLLFSCLLAFTISTAVPAQGDDFDIPGIDAPEPSPELQDAPARSPAQDTQEPIVQTDTTLFQLIGAGGWAMWILGLLSVTLIALAVYLALDIQKKNFAPAELEAKLSGYMETMDLEAALLLTESDKTVLGRAINEGLNLIYDRGFNVLQTDSLLDIISDATVKVNRHRAKMVNYFSTISQAAPMVGLLGTVSGMIKAFANLGQEGMGNPTELAANISEALVTTASGLVVALPGIFFYSFFRDKLQDLISQNEEISTSLIRKLITAYQEYKEKKAR